MWSRKDLKKDARTKIKSNYWATIAVCFLLAFFGAEYSNSTSGIFGYNETDTVSTTDVQKVEKNTNANVIENLEKAITKKDREDTKAEEAAKTSFNSLTGNNVALFRVVDTVTNFIKHNIPAAIISLIAILISFAYVIFVKNIITVGERKFFLTNKKGNKIRKIFYVYKNKKVKHTAYVMFTRDVYLTLWFFTIIGFVIKSYEYKMIPYILADNPDMSKKDVYKLSKKMMKGNKFKAFILDISFWYWYLLSIVTAGLVGIFFLNAYTRATETELYLTLKGKKEETKEEVKKERKKIFNVDRKVKYTIINVILMFFIFAIIGYFYEVIYHFIKSGDLVNRGTLFGPWLPIYGFGGVVSMVLLNNFKKRPVVVFLLVMVISGVMEYFTSYYLEMTKGVKYWDYSNFFLNLNGRICLEGLLAFAFAGTFCVYGIGPFFNEKLNKVPERVKWLLAIMLVCLFVLDNIYSKLHPNQGKGITYLYIYVSKKDIKTNLLI